MAVQGRIVLQTLKMCRKMWPRSVRLVSDVASIQKLQMRTTARTIQ